MPGPEITIIMPVRNEGATIESAVDLVLGQVGIPRFEVVVADGGSEDGTRQALERRAEVDSRLRIIDNPDGTTAKGLNLALASARGEYWVRVDGHSQIPPDYAAHLVEHIRRGRADAAGAVVSGLGETAFGRAVAIAHDSRFGIGDAHHHHATSQRYVDHITHGAYRVDLSRRIGGFDETLIRNQDYDFDYRYAEAGARIVLDPGITFRRRVRETPPALARQYYEYGYWKSIVLRRHPRSLHLRWLVPPTLVSSLIAGALFARTRTGRHLLILTGVSYGSFLFAGAVTLPERTSLARGRHVAVALTTMHLAWGTGFLRGCVRRR